MSARPFPADAPVAVIGAGMVGICCALELQRRGRAVVLIDRGAPGQETSFGNSGVINRGSVLPVGGPHVWRKLPRYLSGRDAALRVRKRHVPGMAPWLRRFLGRCDVAGVRDTAARLNPLIDAALPAHERLAAEAGAEDLFAHRGWLKAHRAPADLDAAAGERALMAEHGIRCERLDADELRRMEPHLRPVFAGALFFPQTAAVRDPGELGARYAALFRARGGRELRAAVRALEPRGEGWAIRHDEGELLAADAVVAAGVWSAALLRPLGYRVPMVAERGYHTHYAGADGAWLNRPVYDVARSYVIAPTDRGLRVSTGVELAAVDAPPRPDQMRLAEAAAREAIALGAPKQDAPWLGRRPSLPDGVPVIGAAPRHRGLWLAFGHGHVGFSTGPATGRLVAEAMDGGPTFLDLAPFSPARFG